MTSELNAARENSDQSTAIRIDYVMKLAKDIGAADPYGTIPEWNRSKDTATPTEATPPQESDNSTPNADVKKSEAGGGSNTPSPSESKDSQ